MKNINFLKPIVLRKSLNDMTESQKEQAVRFLRGNDVMHFTQSGMEIVPTDSVKFRWPKVCFYGSEAVCIYRQMLGLPDVGIRSIDVNKILTCAPCFNFLYDIIFFLRRIESWSNRFARLSSMNAPHIILINEYRMLYEYVEFLQDNNWCGHPKLDSYDIENEDGTTEHHDDVRKSLINIGFDLVTNTSDDEKEGTHK